MSTEELSIHSRLQRLKGRETRTQSIATRFTRSEERALLSVAAAQGKNLREWARDVLLAASQQSQAQSPLFVEVQALRLLLINSLEPLLRGGTMNAEQFRSMLQYVKTNKRKAAEDTLTAYTEGSME
ncbi:MAG TPA: hypothetical protein VFA99_03795 [Acidobacteriaceae bacterium]|nr:hypothetical protein [Acidobacteriaceae bacterium]